MRNSIQPGFEYLAQEERNASLGQVAEGPALFSILQYAGVFEIAKNLTDEERITFSLILQKLKQALLIGWKQLVAACQPGCQRQVVNWIQIYACWL